MKTGIVRVIGVTAALGIAYVIGSLAIKKDKLYEQRFEESNKPIIATVLDESYQNTLSPVPNWNGAMSYSNETVKLESKYTLKVETNDGRILGVSVIDGKTNHDGGRAVKKESLDAIIEPGTRISFPAGNLRHGNWLSGSGHNTYLDEAYFTSQVQAGNKRADRITVLND